MYIHFVGNCNVAVIPIHVTILATSDDFVTLKKKITRYYSGTVVFKIRCRKYSNT